MANNTSHVVWFEELRRADVPRVGGKNASLGEMVGSLATSGVKVPPGFRDDCRRLLALCRVRTG